MYHVETLCIVTPLVYGFSLWFIQNLPRKFVLKRQALPRGIWTQLTWLIKAGLQPAGHQTQLT